MKCDIVIAGGGLVGASLAAALADTGITIAVVEAVALDSDDQPSYDERMVALTWPSRRIFEGLGVWSRIDTAEASPIHSIHVSDRGHFGMTRLSVADLKGDGRAKALGYLVATRVIGKALYERLDGYSNVQRLCPSKVVGATVAGDTVVVETDQTRIDARLLVIADGGRSQLAESAGMQSRVRNYRQQALVSVVSCDRPHEQCAYERFTDSGPFALLPASGNRFACAWTVEPDHAQQLCDATEDEFLEHMQHTFGQRAGRFTTVGRRQLYPLSLSTLTSPVAPRTVAIGNAAHTVHPVAGQGFNLGLRDVAQLAEMIFDDLAETNDPGNSSLLRNYAAARRADTQTVTRLTDGLIRGFSSQILPVAAFRSGGLSLLNIAPALRRRLLNVTMGMRAKSGRLALGLPLDANAPGSTSVYNAHKPFYD